MTRCVRSAGLGLVLLSMASAALGAEPPADLLSGVKVGQGWTFTSGDWSRVREEVRYVVEVAPGRVTYRVVVRTLVRGDLVRETVRPSLEVWQWGAVVDAALERRELAISGCVVHTAGEEGGRWTVVRGAYETFPGLAYDLPGKDRPALTRILDGPLPDFSRLEVLDDVAEDRRAAEEEARHAEEEARRAEEEARRADEERLREHPLPPDAVSHVKAGQRWVFRVRDERGAWGERVWTVLDVDPNEGSVRYRETVGGQAGEARVFAARLRLTIDEEQERQGFYEATQVLEVGGTPLPCERRVDGVPCGNLGPGDNGHPWRDWWSVDRAGWEVFPGTVRSLVKGDLDLELVRVEGP